MKRKIKYILTALCIGMSLTSIASCSTKNEQDIQQEDDDKQITIQTYNIAKSFGYQGNYNDWSNEIKSGTLGIQYNVELAKDYKTFTYGWENEVITLDENTFLVDSRITNEEFTSNKYIYNNINTAIEACKNGTTDKPMKLYIAPGVYWTHDAYSEETKDAYQIEKTCENMEWIGLTDDRRNVVLAFNYGHDRGYNGGNPTCFNIGGDNFKVSNLTIGGYCNIDLDYALNRSLNVSKRTNDITQCQLGSYSGDKLYCKNVSFISRLNMNPFISSKRAFYKDCHFESTDDSLNGSADSVYLNCDFDFYASKPWYSSAGSTLLNCQFNIVHINNNATLNYQYLSKIESRFNIIDCNFIDSTNTYKVGFSDILSNTYKSYYSNVTLNGKAINMNLSDAYNHSVDLTGKEALKAYKISDDEGNTIYNIYNLLKGSDNWDPQNQKNIIESYKATDISDTLTLSSTLNTLETSKTGQDSTIISYTLLGKGTATYTDKIKYSSNDSSIVKFEDQNDGSVKVIANSDLEETKNVIITAKAASGLEAAIELTIKPSLLSISQANNISITQNSNGTATVDYTISDLGSRTDNSRINWYICDDKNGTNPIHIATSRSSTPLKTIKLYSQYVNKFLKVEIESKHIRSDYSEIKSYVSETAVVESGINTSLVYDVDLATFVTEDNHTYLPGYWYRDSIAYGTGWKNGFLNYTGLYFTGNKSDKDNKVNENFSEIYYTPIDDSYNDMDIKLKLAPGKTAGQGFGSNNNFIEVKIKYDKTTNSGYSLRIVRTSGDSTKVQLVKVINGTITVVKESENTSVYLSEVSIHIWTENGKLNAHLETNHEQSSTALEKGYLNTVDISCDIDYTVYGGCGLYLESSTGDNTTFVTSLVISWTKEN